ncbi:MAG: hypothetical protein EOO38_05355 [Cytophagaceae bacterium]|nr:MAG: hypothetical protein EOO38_05355 [Cytophagaceae bacterium]
MKALLPFALLLSLSACSTPAPEQAATTAPVEGSAHTAVVASLKKTLDDPASYQPVRWGSPKAWRKDDANRIDLDSLKERANIFYDLLKSERNARVVSESEFDKTAAILRQLQRKQDSLLHTADTTRLGVVLSHAYRAKNKMGAIRLDSARFLVYKNGSVQRL